MDMHVAELLLLGAGGEPVDFARTIVSHGVAELPPKTRSTSRRERSRRRSPSREVPAPCA
jgi:hypothetical protein